MNVSTNKLQILTAAAMLIIVSGGLAVYAEGQSSLLGGNPDNLVSAADQVTSTNSSIASSSTATFTANTTTLSTAASHTLCAGLNPGHVGRITLPIHATQTATAGSVTFSSKNACYVSINTAGGVFAVRIVLHDAKPVTQYGAVLVVNGTDHPLGYMVTGPRGSGQIYNQVLLKPGAYAVSLKLYDTSSDPGHDLLVLQSSQGIVVSPPFPTPSIQSGNSTSSA